MREQAAAENGSDLHADGGQSLENALLHLAKSDAARFRTFCRRMRESSPERLDKACEQVNRVCLREMADSLTGGAGHPMLSWMIIDGRYLALLLDPDFLPVENAARVITVMCDADPRFFLNFQRLTEKATDEHDVRRLDRALRFFTQLGNSSVLVPWLRSLTNHPDERIQSKAVKLLCELRPNVALVERQLKSSDARVRANAIEALWAVPSREAATIFREALSDSSHRVVVNALVGLHACNSDDAFERLAKLCNHPEPMFRAAAAWGIGRIDDRRGIPALTELASDPSPIVRARAVRVLAAFAESVPTEDHQQPAETAISP